MISKQEAFSLCRGSPRSKCGQIRIGGPGGQCPELWMVGHRRPSGTSLHGLAAGVIAVGARAQKKKEVSTRGATAAQKGQAERKE